MMEQFEKFNEALDRLEAILTEMKNDNEALRRENASPRSRKRLPRSSPAPVGRGPRQDGRT